MEGFIVIHNCNSASESMAFPEASYEDVIKENPISVLDCDYGVGIITKGEAESLLPYFIEDINLYVLA